jgi:hypothetical protein
MSKAGKFIPGGAGRKTSPMGVQGPIRAPGPDGAEPPKKGPRLLSKGGLTRPVPKNRRLPILIMSSFVCCLLVSVAWYEFGVLPSRKALAEEQQKEAADQKQLADTIAAQKSEAAQEAVAKASATILVDSRPPGFATIDQVTKPTPATFDNVPIGKETILIQSEGYDDFQEDVVASGDKPTDLGTIPLTKKTGTLVFASPQTDVTYTLSGPDGYTHEGAVPDQLADLPVGNYQITVRQHDWELPPMTLVLHGHDTVQKEIKFPYGSLSLSTEPEGATVRKDNIVLGQTPLTLSQVHPGAMNLSIDLPPYTMQRLALTIPEFGSVTRQITLPSGRDFIAACGMPMVWVPGGYWVGKYEVTQQVFEGVTGYNPSTFQRSDHPVETVSWEEAMAFCEKLNQEEERTGKLPRGYHYTLPTDSEWDAFSADANIDFAATSRTATLSSTQDVGVSEPNKYGIYDTIGNVWEWSLDAIDEKGSHTLRGGSWLSSSENFPNAETRSAGVAKYADRFTGFRVVLVPQ